MPDNLPPQPTNLPVMGGHPAAEPPPEGSGAGTLPTPVPTPAVELKEVMINGQVFKVDAATAAAIEAQKAFTEQQIAQVRQAIPAPAPAPVAQADKVDYENLMFTDPATYTQKVIEEAQKRAEESLTTRYQQQRALDDFISGFYAKNEDLKIADDLVRMELQANLAQWGNKPLAEAQKLLADRVRERVFGYVKHFGAKPAEGSKSRTVVEGAQQPAPATPAPGDNVVPMTAGALIAKRREQRRLGGKS